MNPGNLLRRRRLSLEIKFVVTATVVIVLGILALQVWLLAAFRSFVFSEAELRARRVAESTALTVENTLLYSHLELIEEEGFLDNVLEEIVGDAMSGVTRALVFDPEGRLINADRYSLSARDQVQRLGRETLGVQETSLQPLKTPWLYRIAVPLKISSLRLGTLVMVFSHEQEAGRVTVFQGWTIWGALVLGVLGILGSVALSRALARPIKQLAGAMSGVSPPSYEVSLSPWWNDEIKDLQDSFQSMLDRLRAAHRAEEESRRALVQAEKLATTGTLVAGLAHEINNPLSGARNCLNRIMRKPDDPVQTAKYSQLMDNALKHIEQTVGNLLDFTRTSDPVMRPVDVRAVALDACRLAGPKAGTAGVELIPPPDGTAAMARGNARELEQVILNLLLNAIDASQEGGRVRIALEAGPREIRIRVSDEGRGIPPDVQPRIFDPFFTTKEPGRGTGLGLWIAAGIIDRHQGRISCSPREGRGTVFSIELPAAGRDNGEGEP